MISLVISNFIKMFNVTQLSFYKECIMTNILVNFKVTPVLGSVQLFMFILLIHENIFMNKDRV